MGYHNTRWYNVTYVSHSLKIYFSIWRFADCKDIMHMGISQSGVYAISPDGCGRMAVYCDMDSDGGGWTVILRRVNGNTDFF